ncbi:MAG TPA: BlaI/MecI/CopY family transcriptional regulator [Steroidobacteraceae bacterium]|jgi:BlaI family penicillinase repressor
MKQSPPISEAEWEIMNALWAHSPVSVNELTERLAPAKGWHPKTVRTMLNRLRRKGAVGHRVIEGMYHYHAAVSQESCTRRAAESFIDRVFGGAITPMVAQLVRRRPLTTQEKRELRKLLDET